jgi:hypothetical protein
LQKALVPDPHSAFAGYSPAISLTANIELGRPLLTHLLYRDPKGFSLVFDV